MKLKKAQSPNWYIESIVAFPQLQNYSSHCVPFNRYEDTSITSTPTLQEQPHFKDKKKRKRRRKVKYT